MRFESEGSLPTRENRPRPVAGLKLGQVTLTEAIGKGGMGEVWKAFDSTRDAHVALKFLPSEVQDSSREMRRVVQTFRAVQALQHPHICPVYFLEEFPSFGQVLGMKFIDGLTLVDYRDQYVEEHGEFPVEELVRILRPVAEALDYAHNPSVVHPEVTKAVIHRDIKPENILVGADGRGVQIVDFGLVEQVRMSVSRVSQVEMDSSGTRPYMAPEQWRGQYQDGRTDQFALAVVAYELLADRLPFEVSDPFQLRECVLNEPVEPIPDQSDSVNAALLRALAKQTSDRFETCGEFVEALSKNSADLLQSKVKDASGSESVSADSVPPQTKPKTASDSPRPDSGSRLAEHVRTAQTRADKAHHESRRLMEETHNYDLAAGLLADVAEELRDEELYQIAVRHRDHANELESEITEAVQAMRLSGLRSRVQELLILLPNRTDLQELLETLPREAPALLASPFSADVAQRRQEEWAEFLSRPVEWENSIGMKFRLIPPGEFLMGSPSSEASRSDDKRQHRVRITRPFYCGIYPVTQGEYEAVMGGNPSRFTTDDVAKEGFFNSLFSVTEKRPSPEAADRPVEQVNWHDAQSFLAKLQGCSGESGVKYRLLTESEWEYSCRARTETPYWFGEKLNGKQANCNGNNPYPSATWRGPSLSRTARVGSYDANGFGLFDTHGNVWEWCSDWYGAYPSGESVVEDPRGPSSGSLRVLRGGSWDDGASVCRSASRNSTDPTGRHDLIGFRVLCEF